MDASLAPIRPLFILVLIWATFLLGSLVPPGNNALLMTLGLFTYLTGYLLYPFAIVLGSKVVAATQNQRIIAIVCLAVFVLLMISRPYEAGPRDRLSAAFALGALIGLWYVFIDALTEAEVRLRHGSRVGLPQLWVAAWLFPFLGVLYVHQRYRELLADDRAT